MTKKRKLRVVSLSAVFSERGRSAFLQSAGLSNRLYTEGGLPRVSAGAHAATRVIKPSARRRLCRRVMRAGSPNLDAFLSGALYIEEATFYFRELALWETNPACLANTPCTRRPIHGLFFRHIRRIIVPNSVAELLLLPGAAEPLRFRSLLWASVKRLASFLAASVSKNEP